MSEAVNRLSQEEIERALETTPGWCQEGDAIVRAYTFDDFAQAFAFLARVAIVTEGLNHHAEIWNVWNRVRLTFSTHDAGGITQKDFDAARALE